MMNCYHFSNNKIIKKQFSTFATVSTMINTEASAVSMDWSYIGKLILICWCLRDSENE